MRTITYRRPARGWYTAWDNIGIIASITRDKDTGQYYIHMVKGIGQDHYEKTLKEAKQYLERL